MDSIQNAYKYVDDLVETLDGPDKITALTAAYVLYNAAVKHYNKQLELDDAERSA